MHREFHLGAAGEVNAQVKEVLTERQRNQRNQTGDDQQDRDAAEELEVLEHRKTRTQRMLGQAIRLGAADVEVHHAVEQEVGHGQRGEHGDDNADAQRGREADDRAGTEEEQNRRRDQGGDVGVQNCGKRALEARIDRALDRLTRAQLFLDALEDDDVGVNRHTD